MESRFGRTAVSVMVDVIDDSKVTFKRVDYFRVPTPMVVHTIANKIELQVFHSCGRRPVAHWMGLIN